MVKKREETEDLGELVERIEALEAQVAEVQSVLGEAPLASGANEAEYLEAIEGIESELIGQGWIRLPQRRYLVDALAAQVPVRTICDHFKALMLKYPNAAAAAQAGHGANLRLDKTLIPLLLTGAGVGFSIQSATPEEQKRVLGYTQSDIDRVSAEHPEKLILDYLAFVGSGGKLGWRPRAGDPRGRSSDDDLYGGRS